MASTTRNLSAPGKHFSDEDPALEHSGVKKLSECNETRYVVRRADGKYLVIASTIDRRSVATWIDNLEFATSWPFMSGATLARGLDLDPCLHAERVGWEVIPVAPTPPTDVVSFSVAVPALLLIVLTLFATVASAQQASYSKFDWTSIVAV